MKLSTAHHIFWSNLLVLWASKSETKANDSDLCQNEELHIDTVDIWHSSGHDIVGDNVRVSCLLYPTNTFNCSRSFDPPENQFQISASVSICEETKRIINLNYSSEELRVSEKGVGSEPVVLCRDCIDYKDLYVIVLYNVSLHYKWTVYVNTYTTANLEVPSPPPNISASFRDGGLLVTWDQPHSRVPTVPLCFDYQLDIGDQEMPKDVEIQLSYTEPYADPTRPHLVRMRTRKGSLRCHGSNEWSEWSHTVTVTPTESIYKVNTLVIVTVSLGVPMILLAVLLLVRYQRVSKVLFPPIPGPPKTCKHFLETNDIFIAPWPPKYEEVITEVEDAEQNPVKTHA